MLRFSAHNDGGAGYRAWNAEESDDRVMNGDGTLEMSGRFAALHDALSPPCRLMREASSPPDY